MLRSLNRPDILVVTLAAAGILMVTMGARQSLGLFIAPIGATTGLGIASISLALAIGQFTWGAIQPVAGAVADRYGPRAVLIGGLVLLALGSAVTPFMGTGFGLMVSLGLMSAIGSGAGSFSVLIGAAAQRLPLEARGSASGVINAGGSFGQFVFAPILQKLIQGVGWMGAMWAMALMTLAALPLVGKLTRPVEGHVPHTHEEGGLKRAVGTAMKDRSYLLLHAGFFTCGFHIAFLVTHLPGEVNLCGLPPSVASWSLAIIGLANIFGSLYAGFLCRQIPQQVRAGGDVRFACLAHRVVFADAEDRAEFLPVRRRPRFYLVGYRAADRCHCRQVVRYPLSGDPVWSDPAQPSDWRFSRCLPGRLGDYQFGDFGWMWYADMALAVLAAILNLPIREAPVARKLAAA
jgi:MFS family permease